MNYEWGWNPLVKFGGYLGGVEDSTDSALARSVPQQ